MRAHRQQVVRLLSVAATELQQWSSSRAEPAAFLARAAVCRPSSARDIRPASTKLADVPAASSSAALCQYGPHVIRTLFPVCL